MARALLARVEVIGALLVPLADQDFFYPANQCFRKERMFNEVPAVVENQQLSAG
jgi:hypothetical protein